MSDNNREAQKRNREQAIKMAKRKKDISIVAGAIGGLVLIAFIGWGVATTTTLNTASISDFSAGITDDGFMEDVTALDYVDLCDIDKIQISKSDVYPTDEEIQDHINQLLADYPIADINPDRVLVEGDTINLDYVGTVDGVEFAGGSTQGQGTELTLGSGQYIPGFEDQVIGHKVGETFDINVKFPDEYNGGELDGKNAVFKITVNGVMTERTEFTDEFVAEYFSSVALTANGYIEAYKNEYHNQKVRQVVAQYVLDNTTVKDYPKSYLKIIKGKNKYDDEQLYDSNMAIADNQGRRKSSFYSFMGVSNKKEYEAKLSKDARDSLEGMLINQAVAEKAGIKPTSQNVTSVVVAMGGPDGSYYSSLEATYGRGYIYQLALSYAVMDYLVTVVEEVE